MKKTAYLVFTATLICIGCSKNGDLRSSIIEGLSIDNYPVIDGSTSTAPLNMIIACNLLDVDYNWVEDYYNLQKVKPDVGKKNATKLEHLVKSSSTHDSFTNLINKEADLILAARTMSADEKAHAEAAGVTLIEAPIALDAFIFIVHTKNAVKSLTHDQILDIYTGKITSWKEVGVGGMERTIYPYVRNANSGSQELMETLVMKDLDISGFPESQHELMAFNMTGAFEVVSHNEDAICYTVYYYKEYIITEVNVKTIAINGIYPDKTTISNRSYPYTAPVYAVIRSDLDRSSMAYKIYEWLHTESGKQVIAESGYIPY